LTAPAEGKTLNASPGGFIHLPFQLLGVVHSFRNDGDVDAKLLLVVTPAVLENFSAEAFYPASVGSMAPAAVTKGMVAGLQEAALRYGIALVPAE
jgi:hypothetical protein